VEPVDQVIAAKVAEMERRLKTKEATVEELRKQVTAGERTNECVSICSLTGLFDIWQVPRMAAMNTRQQLASERKRNADVLVT